jgi:molecular chaperone GrpE
MNEEIKPDKKATADEPGDTGDHVPEASEAVDDAETAQDGAPDGPVELSREEHDALQKQVEERERLRDELLRARADFENFQKRVRRERPSLEDQAVRRLIADLLPVVDNFERAMDVKDDATAGAILEGVQLIHRMLLEALSAHGADPIEAHGEPFNPEYHEAVHQLEVENPDQDGTVVEVVQKGYTHKQAVVRAAKVVCGKHSGDSSSKSRVKTDGGDSDGGDSDDGNTDAAEADDSEASGSK